MKKQEIEELIKNWIMSKEQWDKILELSWNNNDSNFQTTLFTIWWFLIWLGILSFVWINWSYIPDFLKVIIMIVLTWGFYRIWYIFKYQKFWNKLWWSLLFVSWLSVWATIFIIAQTYNIDIWYDILIGIRALFICPLVYLSNQKEFDYLFVILLTFSLWVFLTSRSFIWYQNIFELYTFLWFFFFIIWYIHDYIKLDLHIAKLFKNFGIKMFGVSFLFFSIFWQRISAMLDKSFSSYIFIIFLVLVFISIVLMILSNQKKQILFWIISLSIFMLCFYLKISILNYIVMIVYSLFVIYFGYTSESTELTKSWNIYLYFVLISIYIKYWLSYQDKTIFFILWWVILIWLWILMSKINKYIKTILSKKTIINEK